MQRVSSKLLHDAYFIKYNLTSILIKYNCHVFKRIIAMCQVSLCLSLLLLGSYNLTPSHSLGNTASRIEEKTLLELPPIMYVS